MILCDNIKGRRSDNMTKKFDFNIEKESANNDVTKFFELYKLHKSYEAYINLLAKYNKG